MAPAAARAAAATDGKVEIMIYGVNTDGLTGTRSFRE
jgi:hypothetical protein